ncbi:MAG: hypothetical protein KC503_16340 [Myxococcales bacterium]|nr:hypothetical protein [Myxococcales bacterium]
MSRTARVVVVAFAALFVAAACGGLEPGADDNKIGQRQQNIYSVPTFGSLLPQQPTTTTTTTSAPCVEKRLCGALDAATATNCCHANGEHCNCRAPTVTSQPVDECAMRNTAPHGVCYRYDNARKACAKRCTDEGFITKAWIDWSARQAKTQFQTSTGCAIYTVNGDCAPLFSNDKNLASGIGGTTTQSAPTNSDPEPQKVDWDECSKQGYGECKDAETLGAKYNDCTPPDEQKCSFWKWLGCGVRTAFCAGGCIASFGAGCVVCVTAIACDCLKCFGADYSTSPVCAAAQGLQYLPL